MAKLIIFILFLFLIVPGVVAGQGGVPIPTAQPGVPIPIAPNGEPIPIAPRDYLPTWQAPWPPPALETPLPVPTITPIGFYTIEIQAGTLVYTCPSFACIWGRAINAGTVVNVQDLGKGWLWLKSGDFTGEFIFDSGSFRRL